MKLNKTNSILAGQEMSVSLPRLQDLAVGLQSELYESCPHLHILLKRILMSSSHLLVFHS
jgi:hypothetical protein